MAAIAKAPTAFDIIKFIKEIYVPLNLAEKFLIDGTSGKLKIYFPDGRFNILYGQILKTNNPFAEWLNGKVVEINLRCWKKIKELLKKNVISYEFTENYFKIISIDSEFIFENTPELISVYPIKKVKDISLLLGEKQEISKSEYQKDIFLVYLNGTEVSYTKTENKLLEVPAKLVKSFLKENTRYIQFSERKNGRRFGVCFLE